MEKIKKIHPETKKNIRYKLCQKLMEDHLINWLSIPSTKTLIDKLIIDCKKKTTCISAPSPLFVNKLNNSLTNSQMTGNHFIPPVSPNAASLQNYHNRIAVTESQNQFNDDKRRLDNSLTNSMLTSMKLSKIPKFYFPDNPIGIDIIEQENSFISSKFENKNELDINEFLTFTKDFYNFPGIYNKALFNKIDTQKKGKISKDKFIKFHNENFRGCSLVKKYFNFIKKPSNKDIYPEDFKPFLDCLLELNPSLEFLKSYATYQKKYTDTVIYRIFYTNDLNDDGKLTLREFKKSNLIEVLNKVADNDINTIRDYFSYEHFYVIYCIYFELDSTKEPDKETFISKEIFSKYDGHALGEKAVDRIFQQIPRKFKSKIPNMMCFEDFLWYLLSEEDKTSQTSIKYWFKVLDLDDNGIVTPSEMQYFYEEQNKRLESYQNETVRFEDILCQLYDMIPPFKEYQWNLQNFLDNPENASILFNSLFNLKKFIDNESKDPFSRTEIDKLPGYSDWDKFAYTEYLRKMSEEEDGEEEISGGEDNDNDNNEEGDNNSISNLSISSTASSTNNINNNYRA